MLVRPPLARQTVHVVIRWATWSTLRSFHPQHEFMKLTMELSVPLRVCAGLCQCAKPRYYSPSQVYTCFTILGPINRIFPTIVKSKQVDSTLQVEQSQKECASDNQPTWDQNRTTDRLLLRSPQGKVGRLTFSCSHDLQIPKLHSIVSVFWSTRPIPGRSSPESQA